MRPVHFGLLALITIVVLVGVFEVKPALEDFDPETHGEFKDTWDGRLHLSYWEKWGSFEAEACQAMVDAFNRSQDRLFVHYIRTSQVNRKTMLAAIGHDPPDVCGLWDQDAVPFAEGGALLPLDDWMRESNLPRDYYIENYLKLGMHEDKVYALPTAPMSMALFYNKAHFRLKAAELRAAGLDPDRAPRTIEELDRYADVLNEFRPDGSPRIMGFLPTEPDWWYYAWGYFFGGELVDPKTGKITADHPGNVKAFLWAKRYAEAYGREKLLQFRSGFGTFDSPYNAFIEGKVSMELQGVWFPMFIRRHRPQMDFGVAPFPAVEGLPYPMSLLEADVIGIPRGCRHPKEAWEFVHWVQREGLAILCRLQGKHMPVRKPPDWFRQGHPNPEIEIFERLAMAPDSFIVPAVIVQREYQDLMKRAFERIWNWPVPEKPLDGLTGQARKTKMDDLCRAEIERTLREVREDIQGKLDLRQDRQDLQKKGAG